jgi:hypothetical protein
MNAALKKIVADSCEHSAVLDACDLGVGWSGGSSSRHGPRYQVGLKLAHLPSQTTVVMQVEKEGGRWRSDAQAVRAQLVKDGLRELERQVQIARRAAQRRASVRRHG